MAESTFHLHDNLRLFLSNDAYTIIADSEKPETLAINRGSNSLSLSNGANIPTKFDKEVPIFGVFGILSLLKSDYLIVITKRQKITTLLNVPIYTASDFAVFPIDRSSTTTLLAQPDEAYLLGLVKAHLFSAPFYFTYDASYNVTNRLQSQGGKGRPIWETADDRFFWNRHMQHRLIDLSTRLGDQDCSKFILPVIFGFLNIQTTTLNSRSLTFGLISRRSRFRSGTRYFSRGIDRDGNVSNFNETEQIVVTGGGGAGAAGETRFSYVQTRGSVPVYWAEVNNLRYKPDLKIMELSNTGESLARHFDQQVSIYGSQYLVNLVNQKGYEKPVKEAYERAVEAAKLDKVHYVYFDFHHECKGLRFDRVSVLIDGLDEDLHKMAYFYHDTTTSPNKPQTTQSSVVRTNCMDCLDRTNVVQSALGKWVLNNQLRQIGVLSVKESIDEHPGFLKLFRNVWADNADVVSRAYSGTGALKTDYTRTGKRSAEGNLQDGVNSVIRYIKNNFLDGPRQDAYDLVTGSWIPRGGNEPLWVDERDNMTKYAPWLLLVAFAYLLLALLAPTVVEDYIMSTRKFIVLALILGGVALNHIVTNGVDYVSWPRLVVLDEVLAYNGKGYESGRRGRPVKVIKVGHHAKKASGVVNLGASLGAATSATAKKERKDSVLPILSQGAQTKLD
ncbi:hypothetical protein T439DRAFT_325617 [Meredithblackwellia eburnea MCA 4105]